jgi:hypothetical protein
VSLTDPKTWTAAASVVADLNTYIRDTMRWLIGHSSNPKPHAVVWKSSAFAVSSSSTWTSVTCSSTLRDRGSMANGTGLTIPVDGVYLFGGALEFESGTYNKNARIYDGTNAYTFGDSSGLGTPTPARLVMSSMRHFTATTQLTLQAWQDSGSSKNINSATEYSPVLWAAWYASDL